MSYKILEKTGVENENVDGSAFNNFSAGGKDGVIKGILDECSISAVDNSINISTGEILIQGFRIKIISPYQYVFTSFPAVNTEYQIVAVLELGSDRSVSVDIVCREKTSLIKENLYKSEQGKYESELATFSVYDQKISSVARVLPIISGAGGTTVLIGGEAVAEFNADTKVGFTDLFGEGKTLKVEEQTSACEWIGAIRKKETAGTLRVYGVTGDGEQTLYTIISSASNVSSDRIPRYRSNSEQTIMGNNTCILPTGTPLLPHHAANKEYVDEQVKEIHCISIISNYVSVSFYLHTEKGVTFYTVGDIGLYLSEKGFTWDNIIPATGLYYTDENGARYYWLVCGVMTDNGELKIWGQGADDFTEVSFYGDETITDFII